MKFLVQRVLLANNNYFLPDDVLLLLLCRIIAAPLLIQLLFLCSSNGHIELSDLVSVLTWSRNFNCTGPVEVEMAESIGQLLDVNLRQS